MRIRRGIPNIETNYENPPFKEDLNDEVFENFKRIDNMNQLNRILNKKEGFIIITHDGGQGYYMHIIVL